MLYYWRRRLACTMKNANVPPDQLISQLRAGQPMLDCSMPSAAWGGCRTAEAALLEATGNWQELALFVIRIGFMDDLTYYYLGRAAQQPRLFASGSALLPDRRAAFRDGQAASNYVPHTYLAICDGMSSPTSSTLTLRSSKPGSRRLPPLLSLPPLSSTPRPDKTACP